MVERHRTILVVDDEAAQRRLLGDFVKSLGFQVQEAASAEDALEVIRRGAPDMVLLDVRLPGMSGMEALGAIRQLVSNMPILVITAYADVRQAVVAMKGGANDYLSKPIDLDELEAAIADAIGLVGEGPNRGSKSEFPPGLVCESPSMRHTVETAEVVAPSNAPVLILGPSGAGKEVVARLIHHWSLRVQGPLVAMNCAGLSASLAESELFGHTKGAFTGADSARQGLFRAADGGTLFLDEIGELPLSLQAKLLRAVESGQITPVGSDAPVRVDTRLVAATNCDLGKAVREGRFREDLFYRINVVELVVPPLRDRHQDILPLARQFASEFAGTTVHLSPQAAQCLLAYSWPGNVRELRNTIQRACLLCQGELIMPEHLRPKIAPPLASAPVAVSDTGRLSQVERATILATLDECHGNRTQSAERLGISRRTLINKIRAIKAENQEGDEDIAI